MNRWLRQWPTRWQIIVPHAVILTLVIGGVGFAVLHQQRAFLVKNAADQLTSETRRQADDTGAKLAGIVQSDDQSPKGEPNPEADKPAGTDLGDGPLPPPDPKFQSFLRDLPYNLASRDTGAALFQPDGSPFAGARHGPQAPMPDPDLVATVARTGGEATFHAEAGGEPMLAVLVPVQVGGSVVAVVEASTSLRPIDDQIGRLRTYFVVGWAVAVITTTVLGVPATRRVLRPLAQLVGVTRKVAAGDLTQRVALPPGRNELAQLGVAFDAMVAQLEAAFVAQRRFVADAAHELRTPLTALSASTELLLIGADEADPATTQRLLRHLDRELNRLIRLTNDLLTLSALDARAHMTLAPTDLSALLEDVGEQTSALLDGQVLRLAIAPGLWVDANPDRLRQVVLNLLDNARKYTPTGGRITLTAAAADRHVLVSVEDTGVGIPKDAQADLFQRFYRVDSARTRRTGGTGLGLPIVRGLVEAHGGSVALESEPNVGTRVSILLPCPMSSSSSSANSQL
jgi:two-component system OmpR family sensor kinase